MTQPQRAQLRDFVVEHFSREDLVIFCADYFRDFYLDYEGSHLSKSALTANLIEHCEHRAMLDALRANLQRARERPYLDRFERVPLAEIKTQPRNPKQVFISHAHEDVDFAQRLAGDLREAGLSVWMTPGSIQPGEQWVSAIDRGLGESGIFAVVLSPNAVRSKWVKSETQWAVQAERNNTVQLLPLMVKTCDVSQLSNLLTLSQHLSFERDYAQGLEALCGALGVQSAAMRAALQAAEAERERQRRLAAEQERQKRVAAGQARLQQEAEADEQLRAENERLKRAAEERERQKIAAAARERLRLENERLKREAAKQAKPQTSRRALLMGLGGAAGVGAVAWTIGQLNLNRSPSAPTAPAPTQAPINAARPTTMVIVANATGLPTLPAAAANGTPADEMTLELAAGVNMILRRVPAGEFLMGSDKAKDKDAQDDEQPQHTVVLSEYYIGKYEVTNAQYAAYAQASGPPFIILSGKDDHPVVNVSWDDAVAFAKWLSQKSGKTVQLPTEAQWEKAARGPSTGSGDGRIYPWGNDWDEKKANVSSDTAAVGSYSSAGGDSPFGLADMAGNVWEWCNDWYDAKAYEGRTGQTVKDPTGPASGITRVLRGGSWLFNQFCVRAACRNSFRPDGRNFNIGFRVVSLSAPIP